MSEEIQIAVGDLAYIRRLRDENAELQRELSAYRSLITLPVPEPTIAAVARRWEAYKLEYGEDRDGEYVLSAYLWDGATRQMDLEEPKPDEIELLKRFVAAQEDLQTLLKVVRSRARLVDVARILVNAWAALQEHTPLDLDIGALAAQLQLATPEEVAALRAGQGELFEEEGTHA